MANPFFTHLKKEHREVKSIFEEMENGDGNRGKLFSKLREELLPHMKAEEKMFYPVLLEKEGARDETLESIEEHHITEVLFKEMEKLPVSEERWSAKLKVLKELVDHHVKEEEKNLFKLAEKELETEQFPALLEKFEKEKQKLKKNLQAK